MDLTLSVWNEAAHEYLDNKNPQRSIEIIQQIPDPVARILYNLSRCHEVLGQFQNSLQSLDRLLQKDAHCAVGFFQRGVINYKLKSYPEAFSDFQNSQKWVQHGHIDYSQLGMRYKLYLCEVLYNSAIALIKLNQTSQAYELINQAQTLKSEGRHRIIGSLYENFQNGMIPAVNELIEIPADMIFRPPKYKPKSDKKVDYLGQAKVLSAIDANDQITGFAGPHRTKLESLQDKSASSKPIQGPRRQSEPAIKFATRGSADSLKPTPGSHGPPPDRPVPRLPPPNRHSPVIVEERPVTLPRTHIRMSEEPPARPPPRKGNVNSLMTSMTMSTDENTAPPRPPKRISNPDPAGTQSKKVKVEFSCNEKQTVLLQRGATLRELKSTACQVFELKPPDFDLWTDEPRKKLSSEADVKALWSNVQGENLLLFCYGKK